MIYEIIAKPGSKKGDLVVETGDRQLTVFLKARAIEGKANVELIKLLAKHFEIPKNQITIKTGQKSRKKLIEIQKL